VFVVRDRFEGYSGLVAKAFARAARRFGVDVVGRATWEPGAPSGPALARRIAASGAQAVFVSALLNDDLGAVIRTLRKRLGPGVDVMAPDSFAPAGVLRHVVGPTARGIFFTYPGVVTTRLPPAGARFLRRFTRTQSGVTVESFAIFAAQATEVMLDAIARSDGTRASVVSAVFATRLRDQLIGDIEFDARGDLKVAPITIMRVTGGGSPSTIASIAGATVERVDHVSPELVAGG